MRLDDRYVIAVRNHSRAKRCKVHTSVRRCSTSGIPASGLLTGQDCCKNAGDVALFGGSLGNFEGTVPGTDGGCVDNPFRWCDNLSNNDPKVLTFMSKAFATQVVQMAFDTNVMSASNNPVIKAKPGPHPPRGKLAA